MDYVKLCILTGLAQVHMHPSMFTLKVHINMIQTTNYVHCMHTLSRFFLLCMRLSHSYTVKKKTGKLQQMLF